jgi:membrane-bound inhibitor of C-type lysozyme
MSGRNTSLVVLIILIAAAVFVWEYRNAPWLAPLLGTHSKEGEQMQVGKTSYVCDGGKTISATYYQGAASAAPAKRNTPPVPNGSVALVLSDGRHLSLPQTASGSGIRYATDDSQLVFWSQGNTAFVNEGTDQTETYTKCVAASNISGQESWNTYASSSLGYSVRYPNGYQINTAYVNQTLGPGKNIKGVQFVIPATMATGTNLSSDSGVSIERLPGATSCTANLFLSDIVGSTTLVTDNGVDYSVGKGSGAAAGNLYNETVYAIPGTSPCTAIRYFIHSTQLGNYPPGTVKAFDQNALLQQFDGIRQSLVLAK